MDFGSSQLYSFELWSTSGVRTMDISALAQNRTYTMQRNEAETLYFELDMFAFEAYCAAVNVSPRTVLNPYTTEVKVKRGGSYLFGAQVISAVTQIAADYRMTTSSLDTSAQQFQPTIKVTCTGYLNLFKDRYLTYTYSQKDAAYIAGDMLTQAQAATNGSVGVSLNTTNQYLTGVLRDRTYSRQNIKSELQNLTQLIDGRFDFAFDANKVFYTYSQIGSKRTDIQFTYGGSISNIAGLYDERSGANIYNEIIGLGSGFGADQLASTQDDTVSQQTYYLRQDIKQYNSVVDQNTLDQNSKADLALEKDMLDIPQITISGKELANTTFLSVGDRVPINIVNHPWLSNLNGVYRIEKMEVQIDDNDFENAITLYFDNFAVNPST